VNDPAAHVFDRVAAALAGVDRGLFALTAPPPRTEPTVTPQRLATLQAEAAALQDSEDNARAAGRHAAATSMTWRQVRAVVRLQADLRRKLAAGQHWQQRRAALSHAAGRPVDVGSLDELIAWADGVGDVAGLVLPGGGADRTPCG
jgi:hypothetical protein